MDTNFWPGQEVLFLLYNKKANVTIRVAYQCILALDHASCWELFLSKVKTDVKGVSVDLV